MTNAACSQLKSAGIRLNVAGITALALGLCLWPISGHYLWPLCLDYEARFVCFMSWYRISQVAQAQAEVECKFCKQFQSSENLRV